MTRPSRSFSKKSLPVGGSRVTFGCVVFACGTTGPLPCRFSTETAEDVFVVSDIVSSFFSWVSTKVFVLMEWLMAVLFDNVNRKEKAVTLPRFIWATKLAAHVHRRRDTFK